MVFRGHTNLVGNSNMFSGSSCESKYPSTQYVTSLKTRDSPSVLLQRGANVKILSMLVIHN